MEYKPDNSYWEPIGQLKTLQYWMRTPFYPIHTMQTAEVKCYTKVHGDSKPRSVVLDKRSGKYSTGFPVDRSDTRLAPTGVSVVIASYEPHNKRQEMTILLHPVMERDGKKMKFLSTFRQEIGPCVLFKEYEGQSGTKGSGRGQVSMDALYPPAAVYGTSMDYLIIAQILAM